MESFYDKTFVILIEGNLDKDHDCFIDWLFDFEETLTSFKIKTFDSVLNFSYVYSVAKDVLPVNFTKLTRLWIL